MVGSTFEDFHLCSDSGEGVSGNAIVFFVLDWVVFEFEINEDQWTPEWIFKVVHFDEFSGGIEGR